MKDNIGKNIRILRKQNGHTLQSLSKQIGITHQQLSRIENGSGTSTSTLERIAAILGVDIPILIDEPEATLHRSIQQTRNFIPEQICNAIYAKLYSDVIKPANDTAIDKFMEDVIEQLVKNQSKIRNLMCSHVGKKERYEFSPSELLKFCQELVVDFADHAIRISKNEYETEKQNGQEEKE